MALIAHEFAVDQLQSGQCRTVKTASLCVSGDEAFTLGFPGGLFHIQPFLLAPRLLNKWMWTYPKPYKWVRLGVSHWFSTSHLLYCSQLQECSLHQNSHRWICKFSSYTFEPIPLNYNYNHIVDLEQPAHIVPFLSTHLFETLKYCIVLSPGWVFRQLLPIFT